MRRAKPRRRRRPQQQRPRQPKQHWWWDYDEQTGKMQFIMPGVPGMSKEQLEAELSRLWEESTGIKGCHFELTEEVNSPERVEELIRTHHMRPV